MNDENRDMFFMKQALKQAEKAFEMGEVPVGAVITRDNKIVARGYNRKECTCSAIKHAEIVALEKACRKLKNWRLSNCIIYVTLEPCMMCLGAILEARIQRVVYGAPDIRMGFLKYFKENQVPYAYDVDFTSGIMDKESADLLRSFFKLRRGG